MASKPVQIIGGGGHAKVVVATLRAAGIDIYALYDDDEKLHGSQLFGVPVIGGLGTVADDHPLILAIGSNEARQRIAARFANARWERAIHPTAIVHSSVEVGPGTVVFAGSIIQPDVELGAHVIVNTGAVVDHDCRIEDFVHVAPGVSLSGNVYLSEGAFLGVGAQVIPGMQVGAWSTVGAGGVVVRDVPPGVTAVGVPATPLESARGRKNENLPT